MISLLWDLKNKINQWTKQKQTHRYREQTAGWLPDGSESGGLDDEGEGIKLAVTKQSQGCEAQHRDWSQ